MASRNEELYNKIKACIDHFFDINGYSPSVRDISVVIGTPKNTVQRYLDQMRKSGLVKTGKYGLETEHISKTERTVVAVPVLGFIPCGPLTEEEEQIFKRGRNMSGGNVPKSATMSQYRAATGMEVLFGWLKLKGEDARIAELFRIGYGLNTKE